MVLREIVAERVSGLKKHLPGETPIAQEIPVAAKIISSALFTLPGVEGIIPVIARGKAYGEQAGLWYRVTFLKELTEPSVVAVGQGRLGVIPTPRAPTIAIASTAVPTGAKISIPSVRSGHVPTSLGRFSCGWAITSLTDGLNDLVGTLESVLVRLNEVIDDVVSSVNEARNSIQSLDSKVDDLRAKVNSALDTLRKNTEDSVNSGLAAIIPSLYDAWGIPRTMALTPLHVRNVTSTGFEFQSYGKTTCYYIAIGGGR